MIGRVEKVTRQGAKASLGIKAGALAAAAAEADSIAINGACLTVTAKEKDVLFFEAVLPTLEKTNLKNLKLSDPVHLEPALKVGDKLGGHFVLGHVDGTARLKKVTNYGAYRRLELDCAPEFKKYMVENGSVALDGVSLTIKKVMARLFTVDIIPFTWEHTTFKLRRPGYLFNLECDYLLKKPREVAQFG